MSDTPLKNYAIAVVIFGAIIVAGVGMFSEMFAVNDDYISDDDYILYRNFSEQLDVNEEANIVGTNYQTDIEEANGDEGGDGSFWDSIFGGSWKTIQNFGRSFSFMNNVFTSAEGMFGLPSWVSPTIIAIIAIIIAFAIFTAIFGRKI